MCQIENLVFGRGLHCQSSRMPWRTIGSPASSGVGIGSDGPVSATAAGSGSAGWNGGQLGEFVGRGVARDVTDAPGVAGGSAFGVVAAAGPDGFLTFSNLTRRAFEFFPLARAGGDGNRIGR